MKGPVNLDSSKERTRVFHQKACFRVGVLVSWISKIFDRGEIDGKERFALATRAAKITEKLANLRICKDTFYRAQKLDCMLQQSPGGSLAIPFPSEGAASGDPI